MIDLKGGHRNFKIKRRNPIQFEFFSIVMTSTFIIDGQVRSGDGAGRWPQKLGN